MYNYKFTLHSHTINYKKKKFSYLGKYGTLFQML
jgi:hypothetical protein